jgi:hypothetical protein
MMAYQQRQIEFSVDYIVNQLLYTNQRDSSQTLNQNDRNLFTAELIKALDPLHKKNPKFIFINSDNKNLRSFFKMLDDKEVLFPENTTYKLKRNGVTLEIKNGESKEIYSKSKSNYKHHISKKMDQLEELSEQLDALTTQEQDDVEVFDETTQYAPAWETAAASRSTLLDFVKHSAPQVAKSISSLRLQPQQNA